MQRIVAIWMGAVGLCLWVDATATPVSSWAYQLQGYETEELLAVSVDLLVVDADELQASGLAPSQLKERNQRVLSYLSIGEAEDYRDYWQDHWEQEGPEWLGPENKAWRGNYRVQFWNPAWQALTHERVKELALRGYDGMYLDVVDVYEFYESRGFSDARTAMQRFVIELANTGRTLRPDFLVIVQNAAELISAPLYLETIDGLAKEDTWFDGDQRRSWEDTAWDLQHMERVQNAGKIVLAVDYPTQAVHAMRFCRNAARRGFLPLTAPRELDRLRSPPSLACQPLILPQTARPTSDKPGRHTDAQ